MTPEQFAEEMRAIESQFGGDREIAHEKADDLMCSLLYRLGYHEGADVFVRMEKWYA